MTQYRTLYMDMAIHGAFDADAPLVQREYWSAVLEGILLDRDMTLEDLLSWE